jgi:uncharacterized membrane protein
MSWLKWAAPALAVLVIVLLIGFMSEVPTARATPAETLTEWIALIAAILSAIAGVLTAWKKPDEPKK